MHLTLASRTRGTLTRLLKDESGSPLIEAAILSPLLIGMMLAVFEVSQLILAYQKVSTVAATVADMAARSEEGLKESDISDFFAAVPSIATRYDFDDAGRVVITAVIGRPAGNQIVWQRCGGGSGLQSSELGSEGDVGVSLPADIDLAEGAMAIVAEAYLQYTPILNLGLIEERQIRELSIYRPRFGALETVENDTGDPATCS